MSIDRRRFIQGAIASGFGRMAAGGRAPDSVVFRLVDEKRMRPVSARVRLVDAQGRDVVPLGHPEMFRTDAQVLERTCFGGSAPPANASRLGDARPLRPATPPTITVAARCGYLIC
jgi:hypothetical protein